MSLIPAFKIGIWNAWILQVLFFLTMFIPDIFFSKEQKNRIKRISSFPPFQKTEKVLAIMTHAVIMPAVFIYSLFLPLKLGTAWFYIGLLIFGVALVIYIGVLFNIASTPEDEPVTRGFYGISRHPIYLSGFLMFIGTGVACASWVVILCGLLWIIIWNGITPTEERHLSEKYGDSYREYMNRTPRWIGF